MKTLEFARKSGLRNSPSNETFTVKKLTQWSSQFPAVAALLDEPLRELPPDRDDKVRVCAYPGCGVNGEGLLRCSRCRNVLLCSKLPNTDAASTTDTAST